MVHNGKRFVTQPLSRSHESATEFGVLVGAGDLVIWAGPQVNAKTPVLLKHGPAKSHVGSVGRHAKFTGLVAQIKEGGNHASPHQRLVGRQPFRGRKGPGWDRSSPCTRPFAIEQSRREIFQPGRPHSYV